MPKKAVTKKSVSRKRIASAPKTQNKHPWRVCPAGQHYRSGSGVSGYTTKSGKVVSSYSRDWTCAHNPSGRDQLYPEEIHKIVVDHFDQFRNKTLGEIGEFADSSYSQNVYDYLIIGWTQYWNDILDPSEPLDAKLVKALIASESGFNPEASNGKKGRARARGLIQVTDGTVQNMKNGSPDFVDHYVNLGEDDMLDPNLTICAGIRWLFRKKQLASVNLGRKATWIEAVAEYKSYLKSFMKNPNHTQMRRFTSFYEELKNAK